MATTKKAAAKPKAAAKKTSAPRRSTEKTADHGQPPEAGMVWSERFNQWVPHDSMRARPS